MCQLLLALANWLGGVSRLVAYLIRVFRLPVARDERPGSRDRAEEPRDSRSSPVGRNIIADDHRVGMLAAFSFASYSTAVHKLEAGDRIVMYTHGILEASNAGENFFGHDALCDLLKKNQRVIACNGGRLDCLFSPTVVSKTGR